jgi:uncharacterized protein (DUF342 family)/FixJ family two-component response regulator
MELSEKHPIVVVDSRDDLRKRIDLLLRSFHFDVLSFQTPSKAVSAIEARRGDPFSLIISGCKTALMNEDEVLKHASTLMPDTPRIFLTDSSDFYTVINAINVANIHSLIAIPFTDDEFIRQVTLAIDHFKALRKRDHLKRVTDQQNQKLFMLATKLRKENDLHLSLIEERVKRIRALKSQRNLPEEESLILEKWMRDGGDTFSPDTFQKRFSSMQEKIFELLSKAAALYYIPLHSRPAMGIGEIPPPHQEWMPESDRFMSILRSFCDEKQGGRYSHLKEMQQESVENTISITFSQGKTKAFIKALTWDVNRLTVDQIRNFLSQNGVSTGIKNESFLAHTSPDSDPFLVAEGREAKPSRNAEIKYFFPIEFLKAGKLKADGTIDFKERGEIPFVAKETLIAEKIPLEYGFPGLDVYGNIIPIDMPQDKILKAGTGVRVSHDNTKIYAVEDGQPYLDSMGRLSVFPELRINGDVDYETGNIRFNGNIIVTGGVKQGFSVQGGSLTADYIDGAENIELSGDLHVRLGIVNAPSIKVMGNVDAKFINQSKIDVMGDLVVQKEVIGSTLRVNGAFQNEAGILLASDIAAKKGIFAGTIGTEVSTPAQLTIGIDIYVSSLIKEIDEKLGQNQNAIETLSRDILTLEKEYSDLNGIICDHACKEEQYRNQLESIEKQIPDLLAKRNMPMVEKASYALNQLKERMMQEEEATILKFERQDAIDREIQNIRNLIADIENKSQAIKDEKIGLAALSEKEAPIAELHVSKRIMAQTKIIAPHSLMVLSETLSRCKMIEEKRTAIEGMDIYYYEMRIVRGR